MAKRLCDIVVAAAALVVAAPWMMLAMLLVWAQDGGPPFYWAARVGRGGRDFRMVKLRSMTVDAGRLGGSSTTRSDARVTPMGKLLRRYKLDEIPQFWNVLIGQMSLVGPRPNVRPGGVERYTTEEMRLLTVRPGITDLSSIVFSDEADILDGASDPDACYDRIIRPWKSRLGLLYVDRRTFSTDLRIIALTALAVFAKPVALKSVEGILIELGADELLLSICRRREPPPRGEPPVGMA